MDWQAEISRAAERIAPHIRRTPVMDMTIPDGGTVALKLEHMQHTGSFKARGAFNACMSREVPDAGLVAASGGNHGAAVGFAAGRLGHPARIFVPEMAGPAKISLIERTGASLEIVPGAYSDAATAAEAYRAKTGAVQIHAYDAPDTVAGQGTVLAEWLDQGLDADTLLIAVGGGGLIGGCLALGQGPRIVAVEPDACRTLGAALDAGAPVDTPVGGIAANALGARRIGQICFDFAQNRLAAHVTVTEDAIAAARAILWQETRQLVEPAGATALAALTSCAYQPAPDERIAILICGANPAPDPLG